VAALAELVRRHVDLIEPAALRMVRDSHRAKDMTQVPFVRKRGGARAPVSGIPVKFIGGLLRPTTLTL
jgi:hypothetical protein